VTARVIASGAIALVAVVLGVVLLTGGPRDETSVRLVVPSALGLRDDSEVRVGGVPVGRVRELGLTSGDDVEVVLGVKNDSVTVGQDASVAIKSLNLLGEKYVELNPGTPAASHPSVVTIPASRVTPATDLDQVLDVLDTPTRERLAILINEAGTALTGRHADFSELLTRLPPSLETATHLLNDVVSDNHTLAGLIQDSDRFLATTVKETADLGHFVDSAKGAAQTFAQKDDQLASTLAAAPGGLSALRGFLADLRTTAPPLGQAARRLSATAPDLEDTLDELAPFRNTIQPTLREAKDVAPSLSRLGQEATPVIARSEPALTSLDRFATAVRPLTETLGDTAMPDILGFLEGWGRTVQGRDGLSHQFHGRASFGTDFFRHLLAQDQSKSSDKKKAGASAQKKAGKSAGASAASAGKAPAAAPQNGLKDVTDKVKGLVGGALDKVKKAADELGSKVKETTDRVGDSVKKLVDGVTGR
jgi:virulence factor Mce-like protein